MSEDVVLLQKKVIELADLVAKLQSENNFLKRHIFGKKSERFIAAIPGQLSLEGLEVQAPEIQSVKEVIAPLEKEKQKPVRKPLDESKFEVFVEELHPEGDTDEMKFIGVEETTYQELVDAKIVLRKIKRYKYKNTRTGDIVIADLPYRPFAKSAVSSSIVAEVLVQKYVNSMPIYRQEQSWKRLGVNFPYSSLSDMQRMGYEFIRALFDAFRKDVLSTNYLQADESPFKVLSSEKKGATHVGYQWVYLDPVRNVVFYNYQPGRSEEHPTRMLKEFKGIIQTDGFAGYNKVARAPEINQIYCMAHARRYFERARDNDPERAEYFLKEVQKLYEIERAIKTNGILGEDKVRYRREHAIPILSGLKIWLDEQTLKIAPKSTIGKAVLYSRARWKGLMTYCSFDYTEIDNNPVERSIRSMVIGRKNYLFAGSNESAERAACFYSFFITCGLHGVNPKAWMEDVFNRIEHLKPSEYHTLFPQNWGK